MFIRMSVSASFSLEGKRERTQNAGRTRGGRTSKNTRSAREIVKVYESSGQSCETSYPRDCPSDHLAPLCPGLTGSLVTQESLVRPCPGLVQYIVPTVRGARPEIEACWSLWTV